ncbi:c-type cytochrome biogenesis protein CcmI [Prosthecomicrobium sp. N25]|uniref:c-type cytochrome biogenesis protein CcmI n=1 Tax=Prosthecomicrobium sp. N25 TaxID=3129254 RepID=UPI003077A086
MLLWIVFAAMTALAALAVLAPASRAARRAAGAEANDVHVYKDQLAEVDRDLDRGLIAPAEADAARTEIARRLLKSARNAEETAGGSAGRRGWVAAGAGVVAVPAVALGLYLSLGQPDLPDQPLATRLARAPDQQTIDDLVARVEAHLAQKPEDGQGWEVLAPVYMRLNRPADAARAYGNAIRLLGSDARRQFGHGMALTAAAGGVVTAEARDAFQRSVEADPGQVPSRMYLALALTQEGRHADAVAAWKAIVDAAKGDEPWLEPARRELAAAESAAGLPPSAPKAPPSAQAPGPGADEVAAAESMPPADRKAMIEGMVARLGERLAAGGGSVEEWTRLIRSLAVLGRTEEARDAARKALAAVGANATDRARIEEVSKGLGLAL